MSCDRHADAILEHALGEPASLELQGHLQSCAGCRAALERERRLVGRIDGGLREALAVSPSPELLPRVRQAVGETTARRAWPWLRWVPSAAALVLVIAAVASLRNRASSNPTPLTAAGIPQPAIAEQPRPAARPVESTPASRRGPLVRPAPARAAVLPEVLVPAGESELIRRYAAALRTRYVLQGQPPSPELAIQSLEEIPALEVKALTSSADPEGVNQ